MGHRTQSNAQLKKKICSFPALSHYMQSFGIEINLKIFVPKTGNFYSHSLVNEKFKKINEKLTQLDSKMHEEFTSVNPLSEKKYE